MESAKPNANTNGNANGNGNRNGNGNANGNANANANGNGKSPAKSPNGITRFQLFKRKVEERARSGVYNRNKSKKTKILHPYDVNNIK